MAAPGSPHLTPISPLSLALVQLAEARKGQTVATLTSAIITASSRPYSIEQALEIAQDIQFALYPGRNFGSYKEWKTTKEERLKKLRD
jgi:hypothetical protein